MWLETTSKSTVKLRFKLPDSEEYKELNFSDKGTVQVSETVGEAAIEQFGTISEYETNDTEYEVE